MDPIASVSRFWVGLCGLSFIFGQMFFGSFEWGATLAGLAGLGMASIPRTQDKFHVAKVILCGLIVLGAAADAYDYYASEPTAGNYYAWFFIGPFVLAGVYLAYDSWKRSGKVA